MASYNLGRVKGAMWYAGTASEDAAIKTELTEKNPLVGDLYLNTETGDVYILQGESKDVATWTQTLNLKGPEGAGGKAPTVKAEAGEHISEVGVPTVEASGTDEVTLKFDYLKGEAGAAGEKGTDGATWTTGSGAPEGASGKEGDLYFDTTTCDVYKKSAEAWEKIGNIKGAEGGKGENGADGKTPTFSLNEDGELIATFEE